VSQITGKFRFADNRKTIGALTTFGVHHGGMISFKSEILILLLVCVSISEALAASPQTSKYISGGREVSYETFSVDGTAGPLLILLHGASGPGMPMYREQAKYFADHGYTVLLLHYFDATGSSTASDKNYAVWEMAVNDMIAEVRKNPAWATRKIGLIGFSLGASVVLAAGSQKVSVAAIADWYGSLPDVFFERRKGMPPLLILHGQQDPIIPIVNAQQLVRLCEMEHYTCESRFYPGEGHGFTAATLIDADQRTLDFFRRKLE
jgi:carboxymethylenebutenolidase